MKIIVLDGVDASGKATQAKLLAEALSNAGFKTKLMSFPNYDSQSSALVKMYLNGEWGTNISEINTYAVASAYALDRYVSMKNTDFGEYDVVVMDRYTTSNAIHQASKLTGTDKKEFLEWIFKYEYDILGIPKPSKVFFLDVAPEYGKKLMANRPLKAGTSKDIHESNDKFLVDSYVNAMEIARSQNWEIVNCVNNGEIKNIQDIATEIFHSVIDFLN